MGSCVSSAHKRTPETAAPMKMNVSFGSKDEKIVIPPSPIKEKPINGDRPINDWPPTSFKHFGSKEETFFDSQAWLDSDCEDDFHSVRGDFTPSLGNTPVHHNSSIGTPQVDNNEKSPASTAMSSPTQRRKKLGELFRQSGKEALENQHVVDPQRTPETHNTPNNKKSEDKQTILDILPKSAENTPYISGTTSGCSSSRRSPNGVFVMENEKPIKSVSRCLPGFTSCRGSSARKKRMEPAMIAVNGSA